MSKRSSDVPIDPLNRPLLPQTAKASNKSPLIDEATVWRKAVETIHLSPYCKMESITVARAESVDNINLSVCSVCNVQLLP
jgi:hypothetical protein